MRLRLGTNEFVPDSWPVVCVDDWSVADLPGATPTRLAQTFFAEERTWLFKPATRRDRLLSEDVAEKAASELSYAMSPQQEGSSPVVQMLSGGSVVQREPEAGRVVERWAQRLHILCLQRRHGGRQLRS